MSSNRNTYSLADVTTLITDGKHGDCKNCKDSGYFFLSVKNIKNERLIYKDARQIERVDFEETNKRTNLQPGDILFTNTGTIGRMAIAPNNELTYKTTFQKSVAIIKPRKEIVFPQYLFYLLKRESKRLCVYAEGTTQKNLLLKDLRAFSLGEIPKKSDQKAIAHILGTLDDKIELNRKTNETLEGIAKALFKSWFIDFDPVRAKLEGRSTGLPDEISELFPDSFEESELGEIPSGWSIHNLTDIFDFLEGPGIRNWQYTNDQTGVRFINIRCIQNGDLNVENANRITEKEAFGKYKHFALVENDIVVSSSGSLGKYAVVRSDHLPLNLNTSVIRFRPKKDISTFPFLLGFVQTQLQYELEIRASGSVQRNFGPMHLRQIDLLVPPFDLLKMHETYIQNLLKKRILNLSENKVLMDLRNALLPKLISGKQRVSDAEKILEEGGI